MSDEQGISFKKEFEELKDRFARENKSDMPKLLLEQFHCLLAFSVAIKKIVAQRKDSKKEESAK